MKKKKILVSESHILTVGRHEVFVFGSNLIGKHGKGAAKTALTFGAKMWQAEGLQGRTYGIPTKGRSMDKILSIIEIKPFVDRFIAFATKNPQLTFLVTEIGCGLAGYKPKDIAPLFRAALELDNVRLPERFVRRLVPDAVCIVGS